MPIVYMMSGIQGSGKSTYSHMLSNSFNIAIMSSDALRNELPSLKEEDVFPALYKRCAELLKEGKSLIYDATNTTPKVRARFKETMTSLGVDRSSYEMHLYYFEPNVELSKERVEKRNKMPGERYLPLEVIDDFAKSLIEPQEDEGFEQIIRIAQYYKK